MAFEKIKRGMLHKTDVLAVSKCRKGIRLNSALTKRIGYEQMVDLFYDADKKLLLIRKGRSFKLTRASKSHSTVVCCINLIRALEGVMETGKQYPAAVSFLLPNGNTGKETGWVVDFNHDI